MAYLLHSIVGRAMCKGTQLVPSAEERSAWSSHPEQEHISVMCVPSGMGKWVENKQIPKLLSSALTLYVILSCLLEKHFQVLKGGASCMGRIVQ